MVFSFDKLWKILIDQKMTKEDLRVALKLSPNTIAKMGRGDYVSLEVLHRICEHFNVQPGEVIEYISAKQKELPSH